MKEGAATSFFDPEEDAELAQPLVEGLLKCQQEVPDWLQVVSSSTDIDLNYDIFVSRNGRGKIFICSKRIHNFSADSTLKS